MLTVPPRVLMKPNVPVVVAMSFRGIEACSPMRGVWNKQPMPSAATNRYKTFSALEVQVNISSTMNVSQGIRTGSRCQRAES